MKALDAINERFLKPEYLASDPIEIPASYQKKEDVEFTALLCALFAYGNVPAMKSFLTRLFARMGKHPADRAAGGNVDTTGLYYRFQSGEDVQNLIHALGRIIKVGSFPFFEPMAGYPGDSTQVRIDSLQKNLMDFVPKKERTRGIVHILGSGGGNGARKRYCMFLRWMVRREFPDFGFYRSFRPEELIVPLDVHIGKLAKNLGWQTRKNSSWKTSLEITENFRKIAPEDPLKYDFALSRLGILRECRSKFVPELCHACELRENCGIYEKALKKQAG